jgi:hypothetical protein
MYYINLRLYSFFGGHVEDSLLAAISWLLCGHPKFWILIKRHHQQKFQFFLEKKFPNGCKNFFQHKNLLFTTTFLTQNGIDYECIIQQKGYISFNLRNSCSIGP